MEFVRSSSSGAETGLIGRALGRVLRAGGAGRGAAGGSGDVVLLDGPLGAGKTTLVRGVAAGMGLGGAPVSSPTFVLIHDHEPPDAGGLALIHVDAYRLAGAEELDTLGWERVLERVRAGEAALVIEWAERLGPAALAEFAAAKIRIEHAPAPESSRQAGEAAEGGDGGDGGEGARELLLSLPDAWASRPGLAELAARKATRCPVTGAPVPPDSPTYPFSSERARLADLYHWFSGSYQITRPLEMRDLEEGVD
jgi:tRNA threonylcarbamoyladenosine biosynthesis protein TsaE